MFKNRLIPAISLGLISAVVHVPAHAQAFFSHKTEYNIAVTGNGIDTFFSNPITWGDGSSDVYAVYQSNYGDSGGSIKGLIDNNNTSARFVSGGVDISPYGGNGGPWATGYVGNGVVQETGNITLTGNRGATIDVSASSFDTDTLHIDWSYSTLGGLQKSDSMGFVWTDYLNEYAFIEWGLSLFWEQNGVLSTIVDQVYKKASIDGTGGGFLIPDLLTLDTDFAISGDGRLVLFEYFEGIASSYPDSPGTANAECARDPRQCRPEMSVPEPGSLALLGLGLLGMIALRGKADQNVSENMAV